MGKVTLATCGCKRVKVFRLVSGTGQPMNTSKSLNCIWSIGIIFFPTVISFSDKPVVTNFTTGTPDNAVVLGTTVTLTCSANGYPAPTYTITRGGAPVSQSSPGKIVINNVSLNDEDTSYSCVPTNKVGSGPRKDLNIVVQG